MIDLHDGVAEIFAEARRDEAFDWEAAASGVLATDSWTVRAFAHEAHYIAEARLAEGIERWRCPRCGEEVERRPGVARPIHMGPAAQLAETQCARSGSSFIDSAATQDQEARRRKREYMRRWRLGETTKRR